MESTDGAQHSAAIASVEAFLDIMEDHCAILKFNASIEISFSWKVTAIAFRRTPRKKISLSSINSLTPRLQEP